MSNADGPGENTEAKEAFHQAAEARIATYRHTKRETGERKDHSQYVTGRLLRVGVQTVRDGGENNLHYHVKSETAWMVLKGRVRFYGVGDKLLGDLGQHEGIFLPGGARYWFEKVGAEDLEILQMVGVESAAKTSEIQRINVEPHKAWMESQRVLDPDGNVKDFGASLMRYDTDQSKEKQPT